MSLINQMLKDLEKRRSRDLETSESLSRNITWETRPGQQGFNWHTFAVVFTLFSLLVVIGYLFYERTTFKDQINTVANKQKPTVKTSKAKKVKPAKQSKAKKSATKKATASKVVAQEKIVANNAYAEEIESEDSINVEELDNGKAVKLEKTHRVLNKEQLAEIAYTKGYQYLQKNRVSQGKEHLREALSLYAPHIKAREMLAGIYIKSGRYVEAAELLNDGVELVPEYPLFAKLYARVLLEQNNPKRAIEVLERNAPAVEVEPGYHALLAATYQRVKNHKKATDIYLQLVKLRPATGVWWLGLAISLEKSGKNQEALDAYQRAQETGSLNTGLVKFTNNRVSALKEIGFPEK